MSIHVPGFQCFSGLLHLFVLVELVTSSIRVATVNIATCIQIYKYRQLCLIRTDVDPKFLSGLGKIRIMRIGFICIGRDGNLPISPV